MKSLLEELEEQYRREKKEMSFNKNKVLAIVMIALIASILTILYVTLWHKDMRSISIALYDQFSVLSDELILYLLMIPLVITFKYIHEEIHGFGYIIYGRAMSQCIKTGVNWKKLRIYSRCFVPLSIDEYTKAKLLPLYILALGPLTMGMVFGIDYFWLWGIINLFLCTDDFLILIHLKDEAKTTLVLDEDGGEGIHLLRE